jgi:hypothetical protein
MADPLFQDHLSVKAVASIGGFIGGALFMVFLRPKNVWDAAIRSSVSTSTAIIGHPILCEYLKWSDNADHVLAASAIIGFCSWSLLSVAAKLLTDCEHDKLQLKLPGFLQKKQ